MPPERRTHHRYPPVETAYAALGAEYSRVGKIRDFSLGGLAFEYLNNKTPNGGKVTVDVFLVDDSFHIHNLPCRIIYDVPSYGEDSENALFRSRVCGVSFNSRSLLHEQQINTFFRQYIIR
jgi:hypothetical protein